MNNIFTVKTGIKESIRVDESGDVLVNRLVLIDETTGNKWAVKIIDGEIVAEPLSIDDIRDNKIKKLLK